MKNINIVAVIVLTICGVAACKTSNANANANLKSDSNTTGKPSETKETEPAIEISAEDLGKEWGADGPGADAKYMGKRLAITGSVLSVDVEKDHVSFIGISALENKNGSLIITCRSNSSAAVERLSSIMLKSREMEKNETRIKLSIPSPVITVKGTYLGSTPFKGGIGLIDIKPCEVPSIFKQGFEESPTK